MTDSVRANLNCMRSLLLCLSILLPAAATAQDARWFQVEISIFTNEYFNPDAEVWEAGDARPFPGTRQLIDLSYLPIEQWEALESGTGNAIEEPVVAEAPVSSLPTRDLSGQLAVPEPELVGPPAPELPDIRREAFISLPPSQQDFRDTVRTLERSPSHRLLFHAAWRQPVRQPARSTAIEIQGGEMIGDIPELQGSIRFRFNRNEDRVVLDTNIWLNQLVDLNEPFEDNAGNSRNNDSRQDSLDSTPAASGNIQRIQVVQSREMRSNEFHYLDHPALGIVVQVKQYQVPPEDPASVETSTDFTTPIQ